jgi:hypothetical protein
MLPDCSLIQADPSRNRTVAEALRFEMKNRPVELFCLGSL